MFGGMPRCDSHPIPGHWALMQTNTRTFTNTSTHASTPSDFPAQKRQICAGSPTRKVFRARPIDRGDIMYFNGQGGSNKTGPRACLVLVGFAFRREHRSIGTKFRGEMPLGARKTEFVEVEGSSWLPASSTKNRKSLFMKKPIMLRSRDPTLWEFQQIEILHEIVTVVRDTFPAPMNSSLTEEQEAFGFVRAGWLVLSMNKLHTTLKR